MATIRSPSVVTRVDRLAPLEISRVTVTVGAMVTIRSQIWAVLRRVRTIRTRLLPCALSE